MKNMTKIMIASVVAVGTLGTLAAGCQTTPNTNTPAPVTQPITSTALQAYNWQLVDAKSTGGEKIAPL